MEFWSTVGATFLNYTHVADQCMNAPIPPPSTPLPPYKHTPLFPLGKDTTAYRKLDIAGLANNGVRVETRDGAAISDVDVIPTAAMSFATTAICF